MGVDGGKMWQLNLLLAKCSVADGSDCRRCMYSNAESLPGIKLSCANSDKTRSEAFRHFARSALYLCSFRVF